MTSCDERVLMDLRVADDEVRRAWGALRLVLPTSARRSYRAAHEHLRSAISRANRCSVDGQIQEPHEVLARFVEVADRFEQLERKLED